jgi:hypothetical protein
VCVRAYLNTSIVSLTSRSSENSLSTFLCSITPNLSLKRATVTHVDDGVPNPFLHSAPLSHSLFPVAFKNPLYNSLVCCQGLGPFSITP